MSIKYRVLLATIICALSVYQVGGQDMHHRRRLDPFVERQQDEALLERFLALHVDTAREPEATRAAVERWLSAARIPFSWNEASLEESGIELSAPVTGVLVKVPLETAFELILEPLGVRWVVEDQQIKFTAEDGSEHQYSKIYPLREPEGKKFVLSEVFGPWSQEHAQVVLGTDFYAANFAPFRGREVERPRFENSPSSKIEYQTLELEPSSVSRSWDEDLPWLLQCLTSGPWADSEGAGGSMSLYGPYLHVRQTLRGHLEIRSLLDQFRAQAWKDAKPEGVRLRPGADLQLGAREEQDQEEAWRRALLQPMDFEVSDQPWIEMLREFGQQRGLSCWIDETAMQDEGIDPQVALQRKVTLQLREQPLQSALSPLLDELELNWILEDGVLKITTAGMGCEWQETRIYDVTGIELIHRPREFITLVKEVVQAPWENEDGLGGNIILLSQRVLIVSQYPSGHNQVAVLLDQLRTQNIPLEADSQKLPATTVVHYRLNESEPAKDLARIIPQFVAPDSWEAGNHGSLIEQFGDSLLIRQTPAIHRQIKSFLEHLSRDRQELPPLAPGPQASSPTSK